MNYLLLLLSTLAAAAKGIMCKKIGSDTENKKRMFLYNGVIFFTASLVILISLSSRLGEIAGLSRYSFLLALAFAFFLLFTQTTEILAMNFGSVSLTMLIYSCGFLIPIFYGSIFLSESISAFQITGLGILIVSMVLIISPKKGEKISFPWLIFSALAMLGSGTNAVIQKIHQASEYKTELMPFLFWALFFSSIFSFIACFLTRGGTSERESAKSSALATVIFLLLGGVCVGVLNILNLHLAGKIPAVVQFPTYSIGSIIITGLAGKFIFRETLSTKKLVGFGIGCIAITIIALL
ncbi:MAG: EamA family transporter [Clostridia bacterium]|nr:EamA family transporter [Clostridia bacterium]